MAINPIGLPNQIIPTTVDFSPLAKLGDVYRQAQFRSELQGLSANGQQPSLQDVALVALRNGDTDAFKGLAQLGQAQAFQNAQIQNMGAQQQIANRQVTVQERGLQEKPQYQQVEGPDGSKRLVKIDPLGGGVSDVTPNLSGSGGNPFSYGKMNESQGKDAGYANRMFRSEGVFRDPKVLDAGTGTVENLKANVPYVGNFLASDEFQKYDQARRDFINANLRRESGAAIHESEFSNAYKQYIPRPGDSAAVLEEKRKNRIDAIRSIAAGGGPAYRPPATFGPNGELIPATQPQPGMGGSTAPGGGPVPVKTKDERDRLPAGTAYIGPDGQTRVKQ